MSVFELGAWVRRGVAGICCGERAYRVKRNVPVEEGTWGGRLEWPSH